jgi:hypothetical protein
MIPEEVLKQGQMFPIITSTANERFNFKNEINPKNIHKIQTEPPNKSGFSRTTDNGETTRKRGLEDGTILVRYHNIIIRTVTHYLMNEHRSR